MKTLWDCNSIVLASGSPRRKEMLTGAGVSISVRVPDIDESCEVGESPEALVERLAVQKARAIAPDAPSSFVIAADTIVVHHDAILGKPANEEEAVSMLMAMQGGEHRVLGGFAIICQEKDIELAEVSETTVSFRSASEDLLRSYVRQGESYDKAGAYGIQGIAGQFVSKIEGSYSNVVGLDLCRVIEVLNEIGAIAPVEL